MSTARHGQAGQAHERPPAVHQAEESKTALIECAERDLVRARRVTYTRSPALAPEECRHRVQLAYRYLLGYTPWPTKRLASAQAGLEATEGSGPLPPRP